MTHPKTRNDLNHESNTRPYKQTKTRKKRGPKKLTSKVE